jgi:hypothetical protein
MDGEIISLAQHKLNKTLNEVFAEADVFVAELTVLLEKHKFKQSFINLIASDMLDAYLNEDETPLWYRKGYVPLGLEE